MQKRVEEAVAETEAKASGLRDAREKNVHFSARVVALNARVAAQQKDLRNLTAINASLTQELEQLRSHRSRPAEPAPLENGTPFCTSVLSAWMPPRMDPVSPKPAEIALCMNALKDGPECAL